MIKLLAMIPLHVYLYFTPISLTNTRQKKSGAIFLNEIAIESRDSGNDFWVPKIASEPHFLLFLLGTTGSEVIYFRLSEKRELTQVE